MRAARQFQNNYNNMFNKYKTLNGIFHPHLFINIIIIRLTGGSKNIKGGYSLKWILCNSTCATTSSTDIIVYYLTVVIWLKRAQAPCSLSRSGYPPTGISLPRLKHNPVQMKQYQSVNKYFR